MRQRPPTYSPLGASTVRSGITAGRPTKAHDAPPPGEVKTYLSASGSFRGGLARREAACAKGSRPSRGVAREQGRHSATGRRRTSAAVGAREPRNRRVQGRLHRPARVPAQGHGRGDVAAVAELPGRGLRHGAEGQHVGRQTETTGTGSSKVDPSDIKKGGTIRTGLQAPGSDLDPIKVNNQGALAVLGQSGEFLIYSDSQLKAIPRLAESWKPERRRLAVDVQDPPGREVPGRQADDRRGRRRHVQLPRRSQERLQRPVGVHRRALQGRRTGHRRLDRGVRARGAERQLPVQHVARTTTT